MQKTRRRGTPDSATRSQLIEAAMRLIRDKGYAALTSRSLADELDLSRQIVHYYFKSIDELCIALVQESASRMLERLDQALQSEEPLRAVWMLCNDPEQAALSLELNALALRRPAVRAEVKKFAEQFRRAQTVALLEDLKRRGIEPSIKPVVAAVLLSSLSQMMALEQAIDITLGHEDTFELVDECLKAFALGMESAMPLDLPEPDVTQKRDSKARSRRSRRVAGA